MLYKRDKRDAGPDVLWGEPHAVYAELQVTKKPDGPLARWTQYTAAGWRRFLDGLGEYPYGAVITIIPLNERGRPNTPEGEATVQVTGKALRVLFISRGWRIPRRRETRATVLSAGRARPV